MELSGSFSKGCYMRNAPKTWHYTLFLFVLLLVWFVLR